MTRHHDRNSPIAALMTSSANTLVSECGGTLAGGFAGDARVLAPAR
jgi:hypothetical protein